jgi:DNA-binding transcriptional LysR family regulator
MELRHLQTFVAVAQQRTVTDAANTLDLAPSTVSEHIRALERSLGVALFVRTARGMRLTPPGERLLSWAHRLLDQAEQARREVSGMQGTLRLGALETIAATHVPGVLARLSARHPGLAIEVHASSSREELLADVTADRLAAALLLDTGDVLGDLGFPPPAAPLAFVDVEPVPLALIAAPGHRLADARDLAADALAGERLLVNGPYCSFALAADKTLGPGPERVRAGGVAVMRAWAEQGLGISLLPEFSVSGALASGSLVRLDFAAPELRLRLVWRSDREDLPGLRTVLYAAAAA